MIDHLYNATNTSGTTSTTYYTYKKPNAFFGQYGRYGSGYAFAMLEDGTAYNCTYPDGFQGGISYDETTHIVTITNPNYGQAYTTGFAVYIDNLSGIEFHKFTDASHPQRSTMTFGNILHEPKVIYTTHGYSSGYTMQTIIARINDECCCAYDGIHAQPSYPRYNVNFTWNSNTKDLTITGLTDSTGTYYYYVIGLFVVY